jgi:hypothetical protein
VTIMDIFIYCTTSKFQLFNNCVNYGEGQLTSVKEGGNVAYGHIEDNIFSYFLNESQSFPSQVYLKGHFSCCLGKLMFPRGS